MTNNLFNKIPEYVLLFIAFVIFYISAAKIGLSLAFFNDSSSPVWPPTGLAIALLVLFGLRFWPSVAIGAFLANIAVTPSVPVSLGIALGNTAEALVGAFLINKFANRKNTFDNIKHTISFFIIALLVPILSASAGVASLSAGGFTNQAGIWLVWLTWWAGDVTGFILIYPLIIALYNRAHIKIGKYRYLELFLAFFILAVLCLILFMGWPIGINKQYSLKFLLFPVLLWVAFRSCLRVSILALFMASVIAIVGTVLNFGLFDAGSLNNHLLLMQLFLGVLNLVVISFSVMTVEYTKAKKRH